MRILHILGLLIGLVFDLIFGAILLIVGGLAFITHHLLSKNGRRQAAAFAVRILIKG